MITRITGKLEAVDGLSASIALSGGEVAYQVMVPAFLAVRLTNQLGTTLTLSTFQYLESQGQGSSFIPRLIGFQSAQDRAFFELFTTVKGIGNRKALRAMAIEPALIAQAVVARDAKSLTKLPEIGKRMAETVIAELNGKVDAFLTPDELSRLDTAAAARPQPIEDPIAEQTLMALVTLGETRADAEQLVQRALTRARRDGVTLSSPDALLELVFSARG